MNYVDEEQMDVMAFEMGQTRLRGSRFADKVEDVGRGVVSHFQEASKDQEGWYDDALRLAGGGLKNVAWLAERPGIKQGLQVLGSGGWAGGKLGEAAAQRLGIDPRLGKWTGGLAGDIATGGVLKKGAQIAKTTKQLSKLSPLESGRLVTGGGFGAAPVGPRTKLGKIKAAATMDKGTREAISTAVKQPKSQPLFQGKVSREAGGYMGKGTAGLASSYIDPKGSFAKLFRNLKSEQIKGPFKHHHILDQEFAGTVLNTTDYKEVLDHLNKIHKIYPGDSPKNIIAMMDEKTFGFMKGAKDSVITQLRQKGHPDFQGVDDYLGLLTKDKKSARRLVDDLFKNPKKLGDDVDLIKGSRDKLTGEITPPEIGSLESPLATPGDWGSYGLPSSGLNPDGSKLTKLQKQTAYANRFERLGIDKKSIKYNPAEMMLSKDHIDQIHYSVYNSPKFTQRVDLLKSVKDGSYYNLTAKQKAQKIAEVYNIQKNVSINVAKKRLDTIKKHIKSNLAPKQAELLLRDPVKLKEWIIKNRTVAANLGWKEGIPDFKTLTRDSGKITSELQTVFSTAITNTPKLDIFNQTMRDLAVGGF